MERNSIEQDLIQIFNNLIVNGLNQNNIKDVENILIALIDHPCDYIFRKNIVCNFLYFLKSSPHSSFLIEHLIEEVEKKSLRLYYIDMTGGYNCKQPQQQKQKQRKEKKPVDAFNDSPLSQVFENGKK